MIINILIKASPMGKARPRVYRGRATLPPAYRKWKESVVALLLQSYRPTKPIEGPIAISTDFYTKTGNSRSDADNSHASILDALQDARIILNDRQVKQGSYAIYKSKDKTDYMVISICQVEEACR